MEVNAAILGYLLATVLVAIMLVPSLADSVENKTFMQTQRPGRRHFTGDPFIQRLDSIAISRRHLLLVLTVGIITQKYAWDIVRR